MDYFRITKVRVEEGATGHPDNTQRSKKVKDKDAGRTAAPSLSRETTAEIKRRQDSEVCSLTDIVYVLAISEICAAGTVKIIHSDQALWSVKTGVHTIQCGG